MAFCTSGGRSLTVAPVADAPNLPGPEEERRSVSVLAIDLVGFSTAAQVLEPEDLQLAQREFFDLVVEAVQHAGGTIAKRIGDAVVAVFGAPTAYENDPYRAGPPRARRADRPDVAPCPTVGRSSPAAGSRPARRS